MNNTTKFLGILALPATLAFTSLNAQAAEYGSSRYKSDDKPVGFYVGGHYGRYSTDNDNFDDEDNDLYDVVIGGLIMPYFGIEGAYSDFGKLEGSNDFGSAEADLTGYSLAGFLRMPVGDKVGIYAKAGQIWWRSDINVEALGLRYAEDIKGNEPFYGVGVDFFVTDNFNIDVEYLRYKVDLSDSSLPDSIDDYENEFNTAKVGAKFYF